MKMVLIGLGKHSDARIYHRAIRDYNFGHIVRSVVREVVARCSIVAGAAIVENSYGQTAMIDAIAPRDFEDREKALLIQAKQWMPRLPFNTADILLIDEIGKNITGAGLDVNVVGRKKILHKAAENKYPKIKMIAVRDLAPMTLGNATGVGLVEFCRTRLLEKMDVNVTRVNVLTGGHYTEAMVPLDYDTDGKMLDAMLPKIGLAEPAAAKLLWVRNTRSLAEVECSDAYRDEARARDDLEILSDVRPLPFDAGGNLSDEHMRPSAPDHCRAANVMYSK